MNMKFCFNMFASVSIAIGGSLSWAQGLTYLPFEFQNKDLYRRPDISSVIPELKVNYPASKDMTFESYTSSGTTVYLRSEIFEILEGYELTQRSGSEKEFPDFITCQAHDALSTTNVNQVIRESTQCNGLKGQFSNLQKQLFNGCQMLNYPERRLLDHVPGKVSAKKVQTLRGLLETAGHGLFQVPEVAKMLSVSHAETLRSSLRKIYINDFLTKIADQEKLVVAFQNQLKANLSCHRIDDNTISDLEILVDGIRLEAQVAQEKLRQEYRDGLAQAEADRNAILRTGYRRDQLEEAYLTDQDRKILSMYIGAIMWRIRGGGITQEPDGTRKRRVLGVYHPFNYLSKLSGGDSAADQGTSLLYAVIKGWGRYFDMGRTKEDEDIYFDLVHMTKRGQYQVVGSANDLEGRNFDPTALQIAGLQMGPCYFYAWEKYEGKNLGKDLKPPFKEFIDGPTALGELCFGATLGLGLSETLLKGYR